jgi:hypothetical protein
MILRVPSGRDQRGIEPVALDQECHDRGGARGGEFPVGLNRELWTGMLSVWPSTLISKPRPPRMVAIRVKVACPLSSSSA